jgi:hypothetical protein
VSSGLKSDKLQEALMNSSTRSGGMSLAWRFNAGEKAKAGSRRVATIELVPNSGVATRRGHLVGFSRR